MIGIGGRLLSQAHRPPPPRTGVGEGAWIYSINDSHAGPVFGVQSQLALATNLGPDKEQINQLDRVRE